MAWRRCSTEWNPDIKRAKTCTQYTWEGECLVVFWQSQCAILTLRCRAKVEADQGNHLQVISRTVLRDEGETGNLVSALDTFSAEVASNAQSHLDLARKIESDIAHPLSNFSQNYINEVNDCRNRIAELSETRDRYAAMIVEVSAMSCTCAVW